jgi:UDP-glucuronate 4-epimerase
VTWLVTGCAGFIGYATARALLLRGEEVVGLDNLNNYYDVRLKERRLAQLNTDKGFRFLRVDLSDAEGLASVFSSARFSKVIHLAAQAGVRYSLENPAAYITSNIVGFQNLIDLVRKTGTEHFVFASSSSVYGANTKLPFSVSDNVDHPLSLYAATKKSNELVAHCYAHLYGLPTTGLRFFTVYGPWGRPDMSMFLFTQKIFAGEPIDVFNNGNHQRDFTFIDDIVDGVLRVADHPAQGNPNWSGACPDASTSTAPYRLYNIGNNVPVRLLDYIATIEKATGRTAIKRFLPLQPGDVPVTFADIDAIRRDLGFEPRTKLAEGVEKFVAWYRDYYGIREA